MNTSAAYLKRSLLKPLYDCTSYPDNAQVSDEGLCAFSFNKMVEVHIPNLAHHGTYSVSTVRVNGVNYNTNTPMGQLPSDGDFTDTRAIRDWVNTQRLPPQMILKFADVTFKAIRWGPCLTQDWIRTYSPLSVLLSDGSILMAVFTNIKGKFEC